MINHDDPFYRPRPLVPLALPSTEITLFEKAPPPSSGGSNNDVLSPADEAPIDEKQESDHPFAIKVEVTGKGLDNDWSTAQVAVVSGTYQTYGNTAYNANSTAYPGLALDTSVAKVSYQGFVYLLVPLVADNAAGIPAANVPNKVRAIEGAEVILWSSPIPVWPIVSKTTRFTGAVAATAIQIGSWNIARVNVSSGVATYELRVQINQEVSGNIVIGNPNEYGDAIPPRSMPWAILQSTDASVEIESAVLVNDVLTGATDTVTGLTGLALGTSTNYWLKGTFDSEGDPTGWEVTTTGPDAARVTWTGSGADRVQTGAWYLLARVIEGSHPSLPGFDFVSGGEAYHLEQLCHTPLIVAAICAGSGPALYPRPL